MATKTLPGARRYWAGWPLSRQCEIRWQFHDISPTVRGTLPMLSVTRTTSVLVLLLVVGVGMQQCMILKQNKTHKLAWSPSIHPSMFISPKHQIRYRQHTLASVTKINRRGHRQMQYSETRPALQCDCMRQWTCELQQCLRSRDDRQRRHMPVAATSEGVGDRPPWPPSTQDFKGSYYLRDPAVSTSTFRQSLKTHLFSAYQHV